MSDLSSPIPTPQRLAVAAPELISRQIQWQLSQLRTRTAQTQLELGVVLGHEQGYVSRLQRGSLNLQLRDAETLDAEWPNEGQFSFVELVKARDFNGALAGGKADHTRPIVFLASPMSVPTASYAKSRNLAMELVHALRDWCNFEVYFAGEGLHTEEQFDAADVAYKTNFEALIKSSHFILLWEGPPAVTGNKSSKTVSSIWVEAGMALSRGIPSTYFVPEVTSLPYILQQASKRNGGADVTVRAFGKNRRKPINEVRANGAKLFYPG